MTKIWININKIIRMLIAKCTQRLVNKLILLFTSILILVVVSITFISYKIIENESIKSNITSNTYNLKLVNKNLANYFNEIEQLSLPRFEYDPLSNALQAEPDDYSAKVYLENYLKSLFYSRKDIEGIYLYLIDQNKYYFISREDQYYTTVRVNYDADIPQQGWYKQAIEDTHNRYVQSLLFPINTGYAIDTGKSFMAYHRVLRNLVDRKPKAVISFFLNSSIRDKIIQDIPVNQSEHMMFVDANNTPFYVDDKPFYNQVKQADFPKEFQSGRSEGQFSWTMDSDPYMVIYNVEEADNWKLIKTIPYSEIYKAAQTNRKLSYVIGFGFLLVSILLVMLTSNAITKPLKRLSRKMSRFSDGFFDVEAEVKGRDEIAQLSRQFNTMVTKTNELINEKYKMKLIEKSAILKALEAEINPHFLYNALQAISTKALKNDVQDISDMVDALALTLRYCISGKDIVKLKDELAHIDNYLVLQKARFGSRLQVVYELDDDILHIEIPKLSIQSLVENSIKHALEKVSRTITIVISVHLEDSQAIITVKDNGPGLSQETIHAILQSLRAEWEEWEGESIGLKNVNARLKLIFGDRAGINIKTDVTGSEMCMIIPLGGERQHV